MNSISPVTDLITVNLSTTPPRRDISFGMFYNDIWMNELQLNQSDAITLQKFLHFQLSGKMKTLPAPYDKYFWVDYGFFASQLMTTEWKIRDSFAKLSGRNKNANKNMIFPLSFQSKSTGDKRGVQCYYATQKECFEIMMPFQISPRLEELKKYMTTVKLIEAGADLQAKGSRIINPQIEELLKTLLLINIHGRDSKQLFIDRAPDKNKGQYTKQLQTAAKCIWEIYEGKFLRENEIDGEFWEKNDSLISISEAQEKLRSVKGSWDKTTQLIISAARNYRQWFWSDRKPETKDWLPQNISSWIYDRHFKTSLFAVCLSTPPESLGALAADRIYYSETITDEMALLAKSLYQPGYDAVQYWARIKSIGDWYDERKKLLCGIDNNCGYWFDGGKSKWFSRYIDWLKQLGGGNGQTLTLRNFGINNNTWAAFCKNGMQAHSIEIEMWQDIDVLERSAWKKGR